MLYAIICDDITDSLPLRKKARPAHLACLQQLQAEGRLVLAGPHPNIDTESPGEHGFNGSLIVAEFNDLNAAQNWADADPYMTEGIYAHVTVKPFTKVLP